MTFPLKLKKTLLTQKKETCFHKNKISQFLEVFNFCGLKKKGPRRVGESQSPFSHQAIQMFLFLSSLKGLDVQIPPKNSYRVERTFNQSNFSSKQLNLFCLASSSILRKSSLFLGSFSLGLLNICSRFSWSKQYQNSYWHQYIDSLRPVQIVFQQVRISLVLVRDLHRFLCCGTGHTLS